MQSLKPLIVAIASIAVIGFALNAFAHGGWGYHGSGMHQRGDAGPGFDDQMSNEQRQQFEQQREAFLKETQDVRASLVEKERELQNELAKAEPDISSASGLQKQISELRAQLDQKRLDHMVEMKKSIPGAGRGFAGGGPMMGYGTGGGYCWQ